MNGRPADHPNTLMLLILKDFSVLAPIDVAGTGDEARTLVISLGACSGEDFMVSRVGEAYDPQARGPNRRFRVRCACCSKTVLPIS